MPDRIITEPERDNILELDDSDTVVKSAIVVEDNTDKILKSRPEQRERLPRREAARKALETLTKNSLSGKVWSKKSS